MPVGTGYHPKPPTQTKLPWVTTHSLVKSIPDFTNWDPHTNTISQDTLNPQGNVGQSNSSQVSAQSSGGYNQKP